jgi:CubicO group peptidase (beta-lactamase class C family)
VTLLVPAYGPARRGHGDQRTAPGQAWHDSSPGFVLVGLVAERASGQPYARFLADHILAPLGLAATSVGGPPPEPAARGYRDGEPVTPFDLITNEPVHAMLIPHAPIADDDEDLTTTPSTPYLLLSTSTYLSGLDCIAGRMS